MNDITRVYGTFDEGSIGDVPADCVFATTEI